MADDPLPASSGSFSVQKNTWLASAARGSGTGTTNPLGVDRYTSLMLFVNVTAASGTSPTLNIYLQTLLPDETSWCDIASLTQITSNTNKVLHFITGGSSEYTVTDGTMTAATIKAAVLGRKVRVKYVIAGTNPSFTFALMVMFLA